MDWSRVVAAGNKFAFTKATEGTRYFDNTFSTNWSGMKAAGLYRGAYHFFKSDQDGAAQADWFLSKVGTLGQAGDLPPVLDWEKGSGGCDSTTIQQAQAFLDRVEQRTGVVPMIYTAAGYWSECGQPSQFARYPLWVANYVDPMSLCPTTPPTWSRWAIWQYSESGSVSGVSGVVDMNFFNGSLSDLAAFAGMATSQTASSAQASGNEALTMVNWPDGRASLFGRSTFGSALVLTTSGANDSWSTSSAIDTGAACGSAASFWGGSWNYPELFSPRTTGSSGHLWWLSSGSWRSYQDFGGANFTHFATAVGKDGRSWVFALGTDGAIWTNSWNTSVVDWNGWTSLGGQFVTGASAITWGNGTIELFATDASGTVRHSWLISNSTAWSAWEVLGTGIASRPVAVRWSDGSAGHAEVFARGRDGKLYHSDYSYQSDWPAFTAISPGTQIVGEPSAVMNPNTGPEIFARDTSDYVVRSAWNGSSYSSLSRLGSQIVASDPFGWTRKDGTTNVFAVNRSGHVVTSRATSNGWSSWTDLGGSFDSCPSDAPVAMDGGTPDAGSPFVDAGPPDAGPPDGGPRDAGPVDAGWNPPDAGWNPPDAGWSPPDAGWSPPDAGWNPPDSGPADEPDAGLEVPDAGIDPEDAGASPAGDGGSFVINPPTAPAAPSGGCHCSSGTPAADVLGWLAFGMVGMLRRRQRVRGRFHRQR